jgi:hypothetical protein
MDDAQIPTEAPVVEETQEQTPVVEAAPAAIEPDRQPDLRVPLQEERRRRQEYERQLSDPIFIYQKARELGLADEDSEPAAPQVAQPSYQPADVAQLVAHQLDFRETVKAHPELDPENGDPAMVAWAAALVDRGHKPSEAADIIYKALESRTIKARSEGAQAKEAAITEKELASSVTSTASTTSEAAEEAELVAKSKNWKNPKEQEAAMLELMKKRMK